MDSKAFSINPAGSYGPAAPCCVPPPYPLPRRNATRFQLQVPSSSCGCNSMSEYYQQQGFNGARYKSQLCPL